jgi:hypothetical protein
VRRAAVALAVASLCVGSVALAKQRKRGRVQRVERSSAPSRHLCQLASKQQPGQQEYSHTCWGAKPTLGEVGDAFDEVGYRATVKITGIVPEIDSCGQEIRWYITLETLHGSLTGAEDSATFVVFGFDLDRDTRTRSDIGVPDNRAHESLWTGFGAADDANLDLLVTFYTCDAPGNRLPSDQIWNYCIEYYLWRNGSYKSVGTDYVPACSVE